MEESKLAIQIQEPGTSRRWESRVEICSFEPKLLEKIMNREDFGGAGWRLAEAFPVMMAPTQKLEVASEDGSVEQPQMQMGVYCIFQREKQ